MSITQIQTNSVLDLIPVQADSREPSADTASIDSASKSRGGDFDQALRDSKPRAGEDETQTQRVERGTSNNEDTRATDRGDNSSSEPGRETESTETQGDTDTPSDSEGQKQDNETQEVSQASDEQSSIDAEVADESESQVSQTLAAQLASAVQGVSAQQSTAVSEGKDAASDAEASAKQAAAAASAAAGQTQQNATGPSGTAVNASNTTAVQPLQQQSTSGDTSQDNNQNADTSRTQQAASATTSTTNASATNATFTLANQSAGDARLPIDTALQAQQATASTQVQATTSTQDDGDSLNTARITRGLANAVQQRGGTVTLRLTPPEMGTVRIQMNITGTNVSASFHAESASAQTLLTQQLAQLRTSLEGQGMSVDRLSVQPLAATNAGQNAGQSQNDSQQQGQQQNAGNDGRSRGQYSGDSSNGRSDSGQDDGESSQQQRRGFFDQLGEAAEQPEA